DFPRLHFDAIGSDIAGGMLRTGEDPVFPTYEYCGLVLKNAIDRSPSASSSEARKAVLAACHGFIGYIDIRSKQNQSGYRRIEQSLGLFPENVPLLSTRFYLLLSHAQEDNFTDHRLMESCVAAFFDLADCYPTVLLEHFDGVMRILGKLGHREQLTATI